MTSNSVDSKFGHMYIYRVWRAVMNCAEGAGRDKLVALIKKNASIIFKATKVLDTQEQIVRNKLDELLDDVVCLLFLFHDVVCLLFSDIESFNYFIICSIAAREGIEGQSCILWQGVDGMGSYGICWFEER